MQNPLLRTLLIAGMVFPALLISIAVLFALLLGSPPNGIQFQPTSNPAFVKILWQANPWETVKLVLVNKPLVVVQHLHRETGRQVWGVFYYAGTVLVYLLISALIAGRWRGLIDGSAGQRVLFAAGTVAALIGVTYLRRAECCTSGPSWVLDTWLLAKVYTPSPGAQNWMQVYQWLQPWLPVLQTGMLVGGLAMLYRWYLATRS